jgi:hypothetical protein
MLIFQALTGWNRLWWAAAPTEIISLAFLQGVLLASFVLAQPLPAPISDAANQAGMLLLFAVPGLLPAFVAWGGMDFILFMMCGLVIVLWVVISAARHLLIKAKSTPEAEKQP